VPPGDRANRVGQRPHRHRRVERALHEQLDRIEARLDASGIAAAPVGGRDPAAPGSARCRW
jgi:hypothetical protein